MGLHEASADPETESGPRRLAVIAPEELREDARQIDGRDALAAVVHGDRRGTVLDPTDDPNVFLARVLRRVLDEVGEDLLDLVGVGVHLREVGLEIERAREALVLDRELLD